MQEEHDFANPNPLEPLIFAVQIPSTEDKTKQMAQFLRGKGLNDLMKKLKIVMSFRLRYRFPIGESDVIASMLDPP